MDKWNYRAADSRGVVLVLFSRKQSEVRRVRLVLRGTLYGLPADDLLDLAEA